MVEKKSVIRVFSDLALSWCGEASAGDSPGLVTDGAGAATSTRVRESCRGWSLVFFLGLVGLMVAAGGCRSFATPWSGKSGGNFFSKKKDNPANSEDSLDPLGARNVNRLVWQDLTPTQIGPSLKARFSKKNQPEAAQVHFDAAQDLYQEALAVRQQNPDGTSHEKLFESAAKEFRLAGVKMKDSALEQDSLFYEAESLFFANRYVQANRAYEKLIANYSGTRFLDMAESRRFAIAQYWLGLAREQNSFLAKLPRTSKTRPVMGLAGEARRVLNRIRIDDPTGKLADDATMALANAFFEAGMFQDAADTYEDLRRSYPGTPHLFQAHLFELKSRMNAYYGESYDEEPLVKADQLMHQITSQFRDQIQEEEEYLSKEATAIRSMLASRDYALAKYYERRGENRAAVMMYAEVAKNHAESNLGEEARDRILALKDKEPLPPQYAEWLVDLFPKSERGKPMIATGGRDTLMR